MIIVPKICLFVKASSCLKSLAAGESCPGMGETDSGLTDISD